MALTPGTRLGVYQVTTQIGEGGMGQVYRARDTKLDRDVAIKILPEAFAHDADRLARFQREAKTLASLNHPNIAIIHGLEQAGEVHALVMELVEGEDLSQRITRGAIPIDEALLIAKQIAEALEAAHEAGIIHRDLKPANIKVREDGVVKVLDFGLAKAMEPTGAASSNVSQSPTITTPAMTQAGMILGTAAYMSPEQARGKTVDTRADIWAFGCVLYEMLTGRRAFGGEDVTLTLARVVEREPDFDALPPAVPARVRQALRVCLRKDSKQRVGDIRDVRLALEGAFESGVGAPAIAAAAQLRIWQRPGSIALVAACIGAAIAGALVWALMPPVPLPVTRSRFVLPGEQEFGNDFTRQVVGVSPDGAEMVYHASSRLFLRALSELEARPIQGTESPLTFANSNPVFSPDGRFIAYHDGALKKIATSGGTAVTLCASDLPWGMSWNADWIVFGQGPKGIMRVSANGGTPEQLVRVESNELAAHPQMLPGNRVVLFTLGATGGEGAAPWDSARIVTHTLGSGERKTIVEGGSHARYLPTGHIVYAQGSTLFAVPFDERRLEATGGRVPVVEGVTRNFFIGDGAAHYSVSDTGTLVFVPGPASAFARRIVMMDLNGGAQPVELPPAAYRSLRTSPDGRQVVFDTDDGPEAIVWIYDLTGGSPPRRLTFGGRNRFPIWSADSQRVVFQSDRDGDLGLYWQRADGTGTAGRLTMSERGTSHIPESWSRSEERLSFSVITASGVSLWTFSVSDKTAARFGNVQSTAPLNSEFSPDGRWVAYTLRTGPTANVFVEPFPATGEKNQITTVNGHHPVWLPDGTGLSYRIRGSEQVVVSVKTASGFTVGNPVPVIARGLPPVESAANRSYDLTRDGARFLTVAPDSATQSGAATPQEIQIVVNWHEELKRLVPTK